VRRAWLRDPGVTLKNEPDLIARNADALVTHPENRPASRACRARARHALDAGRLLHDPHPGRDITPLWGVLPRIVPEIVEDTLDHLRVDVEEDRRTRNDGVDAV